MDLSDIIDRNAAFTPDKPAIRFQDATLSYSALAARIAAAACALKSELGIGRGDRVAILAANHPDYLVTLYACARLGAMLVPLNWRLAIAEQLFILTDASVKAVATFASHTFEVDTVGSSSGMFRLSFSFRPNHPEAAGTPGFIIGPAPTSTVAG